MAKTKTPPQPGLVECGSCEGEGYREDRDDDARGRLVREGCYHCGATGWIDEEMAFADRLARIAGDIAYETIMRRRDAVNKSAMESEDGEGWAFAAAENMLSDHEYTTVKVMEEEANIIAIFGKLSRTAQGVLADKLDPPPKKEAPKVEKPEAPTKPEQKPMSQEEIDFLGGDTPF